MSCLAKHRLVASSGGGCDRSYCRFLLQQKDFPPGRMSFTLLGSLEKFSQFDACHQDGLHSFNFSANKRVWGHEKNAEAAICTLQAIFLYRTKGHLPQSPEHPEASYLREQQ